jgi:hypothetical protein
MFAEIVFVRGVAKGPCGGNIRTFDVDQGIRLADSMHFFDNPYHIIQMLEHMKCPYLAYNAIFEWPRKRIQIMNYVDAFHPYLIHPNISRSF